MHQRVEQDGEVVTELRVRSKSRTRKVRANLGRALGEGSDSVDEGKTLKFDAVNET
jgi:hypothetical protein